MDLIQSAQHIHNVSCSFIEISFNDGNANFTTSTVIPLDVPNSFISENFDDDNDADIIGTNLLLKNAGNGLFNSSANNINGIVRLTSDFDADGDLDIITTPGQNLISFYKNNGDASFLPSNDFKLEIDPASILQGDFDNDGDMDLVINGSGSVHILSNSQHCPPPPCGITGSELILPGSINNIYVGSTPNGYWDISNYDNTKASIPPKSSGDTVRVSAGSNTGHFVLYFITPDSCGGFPFCSKHVYVDSSATPKIISLDPLQNAVSAPRSGDINIGFEKDMNASTINSSNVQVCGSQTGFMICAVTYVASGKTININPTNDFKAGEEITVILNSGIKSSTWASIKAFQYKFIAAATGGDAKFTEVQTGFFANEFAVGDIDGDGDLDLLTNNDFALWINKNNGSGSFTHYSSVGHGISDSRFMLSDMDGDKDLDVILNNSNGTMTIYNNNGNGNFTPSLTFTGKPGYIEDIDNDGDLDIVYFEDISISTLPVKTLKNNNGSFSSDTTSFNVFCFGFNSFFGKLDIKDFDNDGDIDIAAGGNIHDFTVHDNFGYLKIRNNNGNGIFQQYLIIVIIFLME